MEQSKKANLLSGKEGEEWDLELSMNWTKNHRERHPNEPHSHFFGKEILEKILSQPGCVGLRFHNAHSKAHNETGGERHLIITGATCDGHDMLNTASNQKLSKTEMKNVKTFDVVAQQSMPCPGSPGCPKNMLSVNKIDS
jgi:Na+-translocating ferredoxin:NAD+ oxidoreductase RnfC subunit